jgi:hypothetical protein
MRARLLLLGVAAAAALACGRGRPAPPAGDWSGFAPYPGARRLCQQRVNAGAMHIQWTGFASVDPPDAVAGFYARRHGVGAEVPLTIRGERMSVLTVSPAAAAGYPHCPEGARADEPTVIIVSRASPREHTTRVDSATIPPA